MMAVIFNKCILISGSSFRLEKEAIFNLCKIRVFLSQSEKSIFFLLGITGVFDNIQHNLNSSLEE